MIPLQPHTVGRPTGRRILFAFVGVVWALGLASSWRSTESPERFAINLAATYLSLWIVAASFSPHLSRRIALRFLLATVPIALVTLVLELPAALDLIDYRLVFRTPTLSPAHDPRNLPDEELVFRRQPYAHLEGSGGGNLTFLWDIPNAHVYQYDLRYDRNGYRNQRDLSTADITVLGDSFVEGPYVSDSEVFTSVIEKEEGRTVANLGLSSYGPQQQLITLRRFALPLQPRVVISVFFEGNDLKDVFSYPRLRDEPWEKRHSFLARSFTKNTLIALYRLVGSPRPSGLPRSGWLRDADGRHERMYFMYPGAELTESDEAALDTVRRSYDEMYALSAGRGARFVVAFAPSKFRVYQELLELESGSELSDWTVNDLSVRLRDLVRNISKEIAFVDLTPILVASARRGELPFFADDSHWSPLGHRLVASALTEAVSTLPAQDP